MKLVRYKDDGETTLGLLDGRWWTVERPWKDNARSISCIPTGTYQVTRHLSPSKGECFAIHNVEGRDHILIHVANWSHDVEGCIGPGMGVNLKQSMVTSSGAAMKELLDELPDEFELEIVSA
jgi:hypothetical protein